jgi:hypothetical protein
MCGLPRSNRDDVHAVRAPVPLQMPSASVPSRRRNNALCATLVWPTCSKRTRRRLSCIDTGSACTRAEAVPSCTFLLSNRAIHLKSERNKSAPSLFHKAVPRCCLGLVQTYARTPQLPSTYRNAPLATRLKCRLPDHQSPSLIMYIKGRLRYCSLGPNHWCI